MKPLLIVQINPEMRVKLERGAAAAVLPRTPTTFLLQVENEAKTTAPLHLTLARLGRRDDWLTLALKGGLTGERNQQLTLLLTRHASGPREAIFRADIGQGTQDLGFRAELPILFR